MQTFVDGGSLVVVLDGRVGAAACAELREVVLRRPPAGVTSVELDAARVSAIDDAVFSVLLAGAAWMRVSGGTLSFRTASVTVRRSLAALRLTALLPAPAADASLPAQLVPVQRGGPQQVGPQQVGPLRLVPSAALA